MSELPMPPRPMRPRLYRFAESSDVNAVHRAVYRMARETLLLGEETLAASFVRVQLSPDAPGMVLSHTSLPCVRLHPEYINSALWVMLRSKSQVPVISACVLWFDENRRSTLSTPTRTATAMRVLVRTEDRLSRLEHRLEHGVSDGRPFVTVGYGGPGATWQD